MSTPDRDPLADAVWVPTSAFREVPGSVCPECGVPACRARRYVLDPAWAEYVLRRQDQPDRGPTRELGGDDPPEPPAGEG
jgi:hypothetical protein